MKSFTFALLAYSLMNVAGTAHGEEVNFSVLPGEALPNRGDMKGSYVKVVCIDNKTLPILKDDLKKVAFTARNYEKVKIFQGWNNEFKKTVGIWRKATYIKVQFSDREDSAENSGWVLEQNIASASNCPGAVPPNEGIPSSEQLEGLQDPKCCRFPLSYRPTVPFTEGAPMFNAFRDGRVHAACDLYHDKNDPIGAVAPGIVVRDLYFFYQGTYAIEVQHAGGFVVRYGEVTGRKVTGGAGTKVQMGQTVGYMGKTNCCTPMLHFELYSGKKTGSLNSGGKYQRRSDLLNPTPYLQAWLDKAISGAE